LPIYLAIAFIAAYCVVSGRLSDFEIEASFLSGQILVLGYLIGIAAVARWIGFRRLAGSLEGLTLFVFGTAFAILASIIAAAHNHALVDDALAWSDTNVFHLSYGRVTAALTSMPGAKPVLGFIYATLDYQPLLLIPLLVAVGQDTRAWQFIVAWCIAMIICVALSLFLPAHGNPPHLGMAVFDAARDGTLRDLDETVFTGIVMFPSFHAAGAVLLAWGSSSIRAIRMPMIGFNVAVIVSAVPIGGHYITDIVGGIGLAAIAIWAAARFSQACAAAAAK
jgi:membrane-associated phospholipid phosphatase